MKKKSADRGVRVSAVVLAVVLGAMGLFAGVGAQGQNAPRYKFDPDWPKPLPNKWKIGGVIGLGIDTDDNVWVYQRPTDLTSLELEAELGVSDCCVRPPAMIHISKDGSVLGSFDAPQGHGMVQPTRLAPDSRRRRRQRKAPRPAPRAGRRCESSSA